MSYLTTKSQAVLDSILLQKHTPNLDEKSLHEIHNKLTKIFHDHPSLAAQLNDVVSRGTLDKVTLDVEKGTSGSYKAGEKTIRLEDKAIKEAYTQPFGALEKTAYDHDAIIFTLGHELKHAQNAQHNAQGKVKAMGVDAFEKEIDQIAQSSKPGARDYTAAIAKRIQSERQDEAQHRNVAPCVSIAQWR